MPIKISEPAPDFELLSQSGARVRLADFRAKKNVVLYFYPKDDTPGCTKESCSFRDQYDIFKEAGAEVIGVSADSASSHKNFADKYRLPFLLLSDPDNKVRERYQISKTFGLFPGRVTFVIDKSGIVRHTFSSQLNLTGHVEQALKILHSL